MEEVSIVPYLSTTIVHFAPYSVGSDLFRIIFDIRAKKPKVERGKLIKQYEVWVTREAVEDIYRLQGGAKNEDIKKYAIELLQGRFRDSGDRVPNEDGTYRPKATEVYLGNPATFPYKIGEKPKLVKTTIMMEENAHKWLKEYSTEREIGMGEAIRRLVSDFQNGTANFEAQKYKNKIARDNSGVPPAN